MKKHFSRTKVSMFHRDTETKFSKCTCSRTSENAVLRNRKTFFIIDFQSGMENIAPSSNLQCLPKVLEHFL